MIDMEAERAKLNQVLAAIEDGQERKDAGAILALLTADPVLLRPRQPVIRGLDAWRTDYYRYFETSISEKLTSLRLEIAPSGDMAWEYGTFEGSYAGAEGPETYHGTFLGVYEKVNGEWRAAAVSLSPGGVDHA